MKKLAVILHGYPAEENQSTPIGMLLRQLGYEIVVPRYMESEEQFSVKWVIDEIKRLSKNRKPDVFVGVSLGGLVLPYIASEFPESRLIFVASGTRFMPKMALAEKTVRLAVGRPAEKIIGLITHLPEGILKQLYGLIHKAKNDEEREFCEKDKQAIIKALRVIKPRKHGELAKFILETDTRDVLNKVKNETLILSGKDDVLMPVEVGKELHDGIGQSVFEVVNAEHFNVLGREALEKVAKWLGEVAK